MSRRDRPHFEVVTPIGEASEGWLVTVAAVRAALGLAESDEDDIARRIADVSAQCAIYCNLARGGTTPPTLGREAVRATWRPLAAVPVTGCGRGPVIALPWRVPISDLEVTEDGVELTAGTDFDLDAGSGLLTRLVGWSAGTIVAEWLAGWTLGEVDPSEAEPGELPPADLTARVIDQIRLGRSQAKADPILRSESFDGAWSGTYNVAGGTTISERGLLRTLEAALRPYRAEVIG